jgi:hypothetical protein
MQCHLAGLGLQASVCKACKDHWCGRISKAGQSICLSLKGIQCELYKSSSSEKIMRRQAWAFWEGGKKVGAKFHDLDFEMNEHKLGELGGKAGRCERSSDKI